jgi:nitronate monooxygenase
VALGGIVIDMTTSLAGLDLVRPIVAAPMAGGASTPDYVIAAARAGALGFLAGGYKTPQALADEIAAGQASGVAFGVNVFAPNPVPIGAADYRRYLELIRPEAQRYGAALPAEPGNDDDGWRDKIDVLLAAPVPLVSFTFGLSEPAVIDALHRAGSAVIQTVTSVAEARLAVDAGVDLLAVQAATAGGHSGTFTPQRAPVEVPITELVARIAAAVERPIIAAGGLSTAAQISAVLRAGARAAMVGTVLLRTDESGASATHRAALADPARTSTVLTRAFTGRPARGLPNDFIRAYEAVAPLGYPAIHHLTSPLRRAAAAAGDPERVHLWAGTGFRDATTGPLAATLDRLAP